MKRFLLMACCLAIELTACDKKEILPGKREPIEGITETEQLKKVVASSETKVYAISETMPTEYVDIAGNKQHNAPNYKMPKETKLLWKTSISGSATNVEPVVFGGNIYAINSRGELVCLSLTDGKKSWSIQIAKQPDDAVFTGGVTANNSILYIATNIGDFVAVDAKTQKILWKKSLKYPLRGAPLYANGKLVTNSINGKTFALNASDGSVVWSKEGQDEVTVMASMGTPALYENDVICAYSSGDVKSFDLHIGNENWSDTLFSSDLSDSGSAINHIVASPVVHNGHVLVATSGSSMVMFDVSTGVRVWEKELGTIVMPVINNGWVFVLTTTGNLVCLSEKDGAIKWVSDVKDLMEEKYKKDIEFVSLKLVNGYVTVLSNAGHILEFDLSTGSLQRQNKIDGMTATVAPIIVNGKLLAVTSRADIYAVG